MANRDLCAYTDAPVKRDTIRRVPIDSVSQPVSITVYPAGHVKASFDKMTSHFRASVEASVTSQQKKGLPVARYDAISKKAYLEYSDGRRQYVE